MTARRTLLTIALLAGMGCGAHAPTPQTLDTVNDQCSWCRMVVSDPRAASQIVAPYEETKFFDDLTCLADYLSARSLPPDAAIYVTDHRTKTWVRADEAVFTKLNSLTGGMGSHTVAHSSIASRDADPAAISGAPIDRSAVLPAKPAGGGQ